MRDFINYLKNPVEDYKLPINKIWSVVLIFCLIYVLAILISFIGGLLPQDQLPESSIRKMPEVLPLWFVLIILPMIEELSFRLWLKRTTVNILISSVFFFWIIVSFFLSDVAYSTDRLVLRCLVALAAGALFTLVFRKTILKAKYPVIFYISVALFALEHSHNYVDIAGFWSVVSIVLILAKHAVSGMFYGYVRVGYGILASYLCHLVNNLPVIALYLP